MISDDVSWYLDLIICDIYIHADDIKITSAEDVTGCLCDITVEDGKIVGVNTKTDVVSGKVLSVSQDSVEIEGYGSVKLDEDFIMYEKENSLISNYSCIIVGYAKVYS